MAHPRKQTTLAISSDASGTQMGVLEQYHQGQWELLGFFRKNSAQHKGIAVLMIVNSKLYTAICNFSDL